MSAQTVCAFLVSYELAHPEQNRERLIKKLKGYSMFRHYFESTWTINSSKSATDLIKEFDGILNTGDKMILGRLQEEPATFGVGDDEPPTR